jgi:hypothetical protein
MRAIEVPLKRSELRVGFGDIQTPQALALEVLAFVRARGASPERVLEPTCGSGAFVAASYATWNSICEVVGIKINPIYDSDLTKLSKRHNSFRFNYLDAQTMQDGDLHWRGAGPLLICGNLPWVTTDALSRLIDSHQLRIRDNPKG